MLGPGDTDPTRPPPAASLDQGQPRSTHRAQARAGRRHGAHAADLGYTVNALVDGAYASDYYLGGDKIDLTIIGEIVRQATQDVGALPIATPLGQLVPLAAVADVELASGPEQINHRERERAITIQVTPPPEMPLEDAMDRSNEQDRRAARRPAASSGRLSHHPRRHRRQAARDLDSRCGGTCSWPCVITYLLMAALFESWLYPFVIILTVPLGAVGGVLGLGLLNLFVLQPLDVLTMLGFVILVGTVVNNPILIVHQSLDPHPRRRHDHGDAILESVRTRIRPIFMTTIGGLIGLLPLVLFPGAGSELYRGLGAVLLGGLLVSTIFTLVFVPALLSLMMETRNRLITRLWPATPATLNQIPDIVAPPSDSRRPEPRHPQPA